MVMFSMLIGGIGLFLLGMVLLTEGLKSAAGSALRSALERLTGGPFKAFLSGATITALVQSSSATTLSTIGFVSAGLLTFPQAVGVIFGAAVGTTSTGWIVSLLGLKLNISVFAMPLIGVGALLRLLSSGRRASVGLALAGFGLIFVGIDTLQTGMATLTERVDPGLLRAGGLGGRVVLVMLGVVLTVVMQSSSAAVAATLTALHTGALRMEDAAVLVIGANVGTTVTSGLAAIGASTPARRTALAHILFNSASGVMALAFLPLFLHLARAVAAAVPGDADAVGLAAFHTSFNVLGVLLLLPVATQFAALIVRLVPERGDALTTHLDPSVASVPPVAVESARLTAVGVAALLVRTIIATMNTGAGRRASALDADVAADALRRTRQFLSTVRTLDDVPADRARHVSLLHALDHLDSLADSTREARVEYGALIDVELRERVGELRQALEECLAWLEGQPGPPPVEQLSATSLATAELRRALRPGIMERTATGALSPDDGLLHLDAVRWIDRVMYHVWRAVHHLALASADRQPGRGATRVEESELAPSPL